MSQSVIGRLGMKFYVFDCAGPKDADHPAVGAAGLLGRSRLGAGGSRREDFAQFIGHGIFGGRLGQFLLFALRGIGTPEQSSGSDFGDRGLLIVIWAAQDQSDSAHLAGQR